MRFLVIGFFIGLFSYACWRVFGKDLAAYLADEVVDDIKEIERNEKYVQPIPEKSARQVELEEKIEELKRKADELRISTDEIKVTKMLEEVIKQLKEKEDELEKLDTNIWLNK